MAVNEGSTAPQATKPGPSRELTTRIASAAVLIPVALLTAYWGGWTFALLWLAAGVAMMVEWTDMTRVEPRRPVQAVFTIGFVALTALLLTKAGFWTAVLTGFAFLLAGTLLTRGGKGKLWAASAFGYGVVIVLVPSMVRDHPYLGIVGLLWMFAVVWATDIAAYFAGRAFGGPKLWPAVSPKKTWSGFFGGLLAGTLAGFLVVWFAQVMEWIQPISLRNTVMLSAVSSVASQLGDLGESALKRHCDVKDSSHLIPGHGGVMDRLDGFWAVALLMGLVLLLTYFAGLYP